MLIQFFVDDSGGKGQGPVIVLAGLWARVDQWLEFSDKWDACLAESPHIDYFKMSEAAGRGDQFYGFSASARDAKVGKLAEIIDEYAFRALNITYSIEGLKPFLIPRPKGAGTWALDQPYFWAAQQYIKAACFEAFDIGVMEPFEIVFDEQLQMAPRVKAWYRAMLFAIPRKVRALAPTEPRFEKDHLFKPLQAADMLAWLQRANASGIGHEFGWLLGKFKTLRYSKFSVMPGFEVAPEMTAMLPLSAEEQAEFLDALKDVQDFHYDR